MNSEMDDLNCCQEKNEAKKTRKDQNHKKKEQFRGSRLNQKTLVESSLDKDADESDSEADPEDGNVPLIVEDLVQSTDESETGVKTENSDVPITIQDKRDIDDEHETPMFYGPLKSSTSLQSIKQQSNSRDEETECDGRNTSDEDFPEFLPDKTTSCPKRKQKRRTIKRQETKECSSDDTDTSDLVVTDKEYYSIRHETEYQIENQREFIVSDDEPGQAEVEKTTLQNEAEEEEENDTDTSDLEVTNKEYYTIRHETEMSVRKEKEFIISFSPKRNVIRMQSCDETCNLGDPWKPATDLFRVEDEKDEETTDDDISCDEEDFMTFDEYMQAHKTDYSFKMCSKDKIRSDISFKEEEVVVEDDSSTESLRESPFPDRSLADLDGDTEEEEEDEIECSEANRASILDPEENFSIEFMNHNQIDGFVAVVTQEKTELGEVADQQLLTVDNISIKSRGDEDTETEELENSEFKNQKLSSKDETDEENLSDFTEDPEVLSMAREYKLTDRLNGMLKISASIDGDQVTVETSCEIKESRELDQENKASFEEEVIECPQVNSQEEAESLQEFDLDDLTTSLSRVSFQQKQQIRSKKKRYQLQTVKTEEL